MDGIPTREQCKGSRAVIPESRVDGDGVAWCPECGRTVLATACPETDGRDHWVEVHRPRLVLRQDPELAWFDRLADVEALATLGGEVEPW